MIDKRNVTPSPMGSSRIPFKATWLGLLVVIVLGVVAQQLGNGLLIGVLCVGGILFIAGGVIWYTVRTRRTL